MKLYVMFGAKRLPPLEAKTEKKSSQRGAILFAVLVFMAFITGLYATVLRVSTSGGRAAAAFANAMRADEIGRAAVDLVVAAAASEDNSNKEAKRGGAFAASFGDAAVSVNYVSEAARIDVNQAPPEFLAALFRAAGLDPGEVSSIEDRIKAFRQPLNGTQSQSQNQGQTPGQGPAQGQNQSQNQGEGQIQQFPQGQAPGQGQALIDNVDLIGAAWDISASVVALVSPVLTVANGTPTVDPTLANRLIISALTGGDGPKADEFLERRRRGFLSEQEALSQFSPDMQKFAGFTAANAYRAVATVEIGNRFRRKYEFIVASPEKSNAEIKTFSWRILP